MNEIKEESLKQIRLILNSYHRTNFESVWNGIKKRIEITDEILKHEKL